MCVVLHISYLNLAEKILGRFKRVKIFQTPHKIFVCVAAKQAAQTVSRWRYGDMEHFCVKSTGVKQFHKKITKFLWLLNLVLTKLNHVPTNLQSLLPQLFPPNKTIKMFFNVTFV